MDPAVHLVPSDVDGGPIEVVSSGSGPGVVVVPGGGTDADTYGRLAERLSPYFTVHRVNRRGRGASAARAADYGLATEVGDIGSVLAQTGSARLVGHSVGGYFALAAARGVPGVERVALFDPTVSVDGSFPHDFLDEFERLVDAGDAVGALVVAARGLRNPGPDLPDPVARAAVRAVQLTPPGRTMVRLIGTVPAESRLAVAGDGPAEQWASVGAATRFYVGARSPDYYLPSACALAAVMPAASVEVIPKLGHDAVARAPKDLVASLVNFLRG